MDANPVIAITNIVTAGVAVALAAAALTGIGYPYVMNTRSFHPIDPRKSALRNALFQDILGARPQT